MSEPEGHGAQSARGGIHAAAAADNLKAIAAISLAMASFACGDTLMKLASTSLPTSELLFIRGTVVFGVSLGVAFFTAALRELRHVFAPLTARAFLRCVFAVAALALGELSASKLASIPGAQTYAEKLFIAMHAGLSNDLSAQSLALLALTIVPALGLWWTGTSQKGGR